MTFIEWLDQITEIIPDREIQVTDVTTDEIIYDGTANRAYRLPNYIVEDEYTLYTDYGNILGVIIREV